MLRKAWVSLAVLVAIAIALLSLAYPSVAVSNLGIQPITSLATHTIQYTVGYPQMSSSTFLAGYSTFTAWYPGNPICDPASNACTPYPTPTATFVYPQSMTNTYEVTQESQTTSTYTSEYTLLSTQTSFQNVPPYAAVGLTEFQFGIAAMVIVVVVVLSLLLLTTSRGPMVTPQARSSRLGSARSTKFCQQCGAETSMADKFCSKCGAQLE
jgi:hypothetical protein